jgi:hypothetical protein
VKKLETKGTWRREARNVGKYRGFSEENIIFRFRLKTKIFFSELKQNYFKLIFFVISCREENTF